MRSNLGMNRVQAMSTGGQYRATAAPVTGRMSPASPVGRFNRADDKRDGDDKPKDEDKPNDNDTTPDNDTTDDEKDGREDDDKQDKPVTTQKSYSSLW